MKLTHALALVLSAVTLLSAGTGCKKVSKSLTEKAIEEGTGAKNVDLSDNKMKFEGPNGQKMAMGENVPLPDGWPKDRIPAYPGAKITGAVSMGGQLSLIAESADSPEKVKAFYKGKLSSYKEEAMFTTPQGFTAAYKNATETIALTANNTGDEKTMISVSITPDKK
jgi:hypothetical protein